MAACQHHHYYFFLKKDKKKQLKANREARVRVRARERGGGGDMDPQQDPWWLPTLKPVVRANALFLRNTWTRPRDQLERVCNAIRGRAMEVEEELNRCQRSPERPQNKEGEAPDGKISHGAEEQQKETYALSLTTQHVEDKLQLHPDVVLPCPYLLGCRHPCVALPAHVLSPEQMKPNEEAVKGNIHLGKYTENKKRSFENIRVPQSVGGTQSAALVLPFSRGKQLELQPPVTNPPCPEGPTPYLPNERGPRGSTSQFNTSTISCEEVKANNLPPPRGADGVGVNARSWASVVKAGTKAGTSCPSRESQTLCLSADSYC